MAIAYLNGGHLDHQLPIRDSEEPMSVVDGILPGLVLLAALGCGLGGASLTGCGGNP
jgi:hypothetical protein